MNQQKELTQYPYSNYRTRTASENKVIHRINKKWVLSGYNKGLITFEIMTKWLEYLDNDFPIGRTNKGYYYYERN